MMLALPLAGADPVTVVSVALAALVVAAGAHPSA